MQHQLVQQTARVPKQKDPPLHAGEAWHEEGDPKAELEVPGARHVGACNEPGQGNRDRKTEKSPQRRNDESISQRCSYVWIVPRVSPMTEAEPKRIERP